MPKIYTKRGDQGTTDIYRGRRADRLSKADPLYFLLGKLDETAVWLGKCSLIECMPEKHARYLRVLQQVIIEVSATIQRPETAYVTTVPVMETLIDELTDDLPPLTKFLLTVASPDDGVCQTTRVIAREAERLAIAYYTDQSSLRSSESTPGILQFLNRLSDYLFTLGRFVAAMTAENEHVSNRAIIEEFMQEYYPENGQDD